MEDNNIIKNRYTSRIFCVSICLLLLLFCSGCQASPAEYKITVEGEAAEAGIIQYAGLEMNVYADQASNPCGDCPDQPVSIIAGTSAEKTAEAMAEGIRRADDIWEVQNCADGVLILTEKRSEAGTIKNEPVLSAPEGLKLTGTLTCRHTTNPGSGTGSENTASSETRSVTHLDGTSIQVPVTAGRIAAIYGPSYEICTALGAEDRIVVAADVQYENFPWAVRIFRKLSRLPVLENVHSSVNYEELLSYSPDLVLTFNRPNELAQLRKSGIAAVNGLTPGSLDDVKALVQVYADAIGGNAPERARMYADYFDKKIDYIAQRTSSLPEEQKPSVYYAGVDLLTTYGKQSDIIEAVEVAGGIPVTRELNGGNHTAINYEQLTSWNPSFIFIDHGGMNDRKTVEEILNGTENNRRYQSISAVQDNKIYLVPSGTFYWDMGIQKVLLVEYMAKILHPDLFSELDMNEELRDFYRTFFSCELTEEDAERILERKNPVSG